MSEEFEFDAQNRSLQIVQTAWRVRRFVELQLAGGLFVHILGIGLAAPAVLAHELHAEQPVALAG